eukprot:Selendium_serpulae@DN5486_c0_g1_i1.p1
MDPTESQHREAEAAASKSISRSSASLLFKRMDRSLVTYFKLQELSLAAVMGFDSVAELEKLQIGDTDFTLHERHKKMIAFCERHRKTFTALLTQFPDLMKGPLAPLIRLAPMTLSFENKRVYFRGKLMSMRQGERPPALTIRVQRDNVFNTSYNQLRSKSTEAMKGKLIVEFTGEEGVDAGGLTREWFGILAREMFNAHYALFRGEGEKAEFKHPSPFSYINENHLDYFTFIGRVIGKALYDGVYLDSHFTRAFYKLMLGRRIIPQDAESLDPEFYKNLMMILEHDINDIGLDELTFNVEVDEFGRRRVVELKPGGENIPVTNDNKHQYVQLMCEHKVQEGVKPQLEAFLKGFHELMPAKLLFIFDDKELELLISGLPKIDLEDLKRHTNYYNYTTTSKHIKWFWEILGEFDQNRLAGFLQFVTGTSRVPLGGFENLMGTRGPQPMYIHRAFGDERLPSAHTCFNQLDLPEYSTKEKMRSKLIQAVTLGSEGFGFL